MPLPAGPAVALWLLKTAVTPDAYTRVVNTIRSKPQYKRLAAEVRRDTGIRVGYRYRKWLKSETTWLALTARTNEAYEELIESLTAEEAKGVLRRRPPDREQAQTLVDSTIEFFLPTLDPSLATAVADERAEHRHQEVLNRFDATLAYEDRLELLPVAARQVLSSDLVHRGAAERLVDGVLAGDPRTVISGWWRATPDWLAHAELLRVLALLAQAYGLWRESSEFFESAADLGLDAARLYAKAAFEAGANEDAGRRDEMLAKARALGTDVAFVELVTALLADDWDTVLALIDEVDAPDDPFTAAAYGFALRNARGLNQAIAFMSRVVEEHAAYTHMQIHLARLLLERSFSPTATGRERDRETALQLATAARDSRRRWRGDTTEPVVLACRAALLLRRLDDVARLGQPVPNGEATAEEAAVPDVQFSVAQAAIASGHPDAAEQAAATGTAFHQEMIRAEVLASSGAEDAEISEQFGRAWELAISDEDKVAVWLSASMAGVEPPPGADELALYDDALVAKCAASSHLAHDRHDEAIALLRPMRTDHMARRLLTTVYVAMGNIDAAVSELLDISQRFATIEPVVRLVELLIGVDRVDEAVVYSDRALRSVPAGRPERSLLHEVGVAAAHNRDDWSDMESRVRSWINDVGLDRRRSYLLAIARFNQADQEGAWQVLQEAGDPDAETPLEAQLWIALHSKFEPIAETLATALALADRYPDDDTIRALAVNAFMLKGDGILQSEEDLIRWRALVDARAADPAPTDTFVAVTVPDDSAGLVETFRPFLEPQARRVEEWLGKVRTEGWPYGMLAVAAGRTYTQALAQRAAGFLPIASMSPTVAEAGLSSAMDALASGQAIVDISAVAVAFYVQEVWPDLLAAFSTLSVTQVSRRDAAVAADSMSVRSTESLSWDLRTGRPVVHETSEHELDQLEQHVSWINEQVSSLSVVNVNAELEGEASDNFEAWMSSLRAARSSGVSLWADDVGLRTVARNEGVQTFGSIDLLRALQRAGRVQDDRISDAVRVLRDAYCVDFELDAEWLIDRARRAEWRPSPALTAMSRPSSWVDLAAGYALWERIASEAGETDHARVPAWVFAAALGIADSVKPFDSVQLVAGILVKAAGAVESDPDAFAACADAAVQALTERGLPDPTELALAMAMDLLTQRVGATAAATAIAQLGAALSDPHREALRRILFDI